MKKTYTNSLNLFKKVTQFGCLLLLMSTKNHLQSQTTIYTTDFGTVANVNPANWTFTGIGMNISTNNASSGYAGASGGACLGEGNSTTFTNTAGNQQLTSPLGLSEAILQISTSSYSNVALSFGMRKSSAGYNSNATYTLAWSSDGINYTDIIYTEAAAGSWGLASGAGLTLPLAAANQPSLYVKWSFNRTAASSNFKIDDVSIIGNIPNITPATISFLSNDTTVLENVPSANVYLKLTSVSSASSAVNVTVSALSSASAGDYTLGVSTLTFAANAPINSTAAINISLNNDALPESAEYIILHLSNANNANIGTISQFAFYITDDDKAIPVASNALTLNLLGGFSNGLSGSNSAEIVAHDPGTQRLFIANSIGAKLDIVDFVNPSSASLIVSVPITTYGNINSVAVKNGIVALAIENGTNPQDSGKVVFLNTDGVFLKQVKVGMMPDMITFNNAGTKVITANEGEPNAAYTVDPDGSISIIDISGGITALTQTNVSHITFTVYNGQENILRAQGIRIYGLNANASKDFEPEYVTVSPDDTKAWISLQENNALVEINLTNNSINYIKALGTKDHSLPNNGMDVSNVTRGVNIANFPVKGFYLPDAIASYTVGGNTYIVSANEGDARAYTGFSEESRVSQLNLDPVKFPNGTALKNNYVLGRLNVTNKFGDNEGDNDIDTIYTYGSRSFSIWNATTGNLVYDSKDDLEQITASNSYSVLFNASNSNATRKDRSDDKGPEPEGVAIGRIGSSIYAFIALERIGGVMVYDVTNPNAPVFVTYANNRSLPSNGPDLGSEGIIFIPQSQSPNGQHIVVVANEVSSTLSFYGIPGCTTPLNSLLTVSGNTSSPCANSAPVFSVASAGSANYQWNNAGTPIVGATANTFVPSQSGTFAVTISTSTNCLTNSVAKTLTILPTPTLLVSGPTSVCVGSSISQTVSGASSYSWSSGATTSVVSLTPSASGIFTITGTDSNGCFSATTKSITVELVPQLTLTSSSSSICSTQSVSISASGASSYSWSNASSNFSIVVNPNNTASYSVIGTNSNGCSNNSSITINVVATPTLSVSGNTLNCLGNSVTQTVTGAPTFSWSSGQTSSVVTLSPNTTTTYTITGINNGCSKTLTRTITVASIPTISINGPSLVCIGSTITQTVSGANNYFWNFGSTNSVVVISNTINTTYTVTGYNVTGCETTLVKTINVSPIPQLIASSTSSLICVGETTSLTASGASTYQWSNGNSGNTISISPIVTTTYIVTGISTDNCVASAKITQSVAECTGITQTENNLQDLILFPNPSKTQFALQHSDIRDQVTVSIINGLGEIVMQLENYQMNDSIDVSEFAKGLYFVNVKLNNKQMVKKLVIE